MPNMFDYYYGQDPQAREMNNARNYMSYNPQPAGQVQVGNDMGMSQMIQGQNATAAGGDAMGQAAMASGNPYLAAGGAMLKVYGAYQDEKARRAQQREEQRRYQRDIDYRDRQAQLQQRRAAEADALNKRAADFQYGTGYLDRMLNLASYKGA